MSRAKIWSIVSAIGAIAMSTAAWAADTYPSTHSTGQVNLRFGIPIVSNNPDATTVAAFCAIGGSLPTSNSYANLGTFSGSVATPKRITPSASFSFTTTAENSAKNHTYGCSIISTDTVNNRTIRGSVSGTWDDAGTTPDTTVFTIPAPPTPAPTLAPTAKPTPTPTVAPTATPMLTPQPSLAPISFTAGVSVSVSNIETGSQLLVHCVVKAPSTAFGPDITGDANPQTKTARNTFYGAGVALVVPGSFAAAGATGTCTATLVPFAPASFNVVYGNGNSRSFTVSAAYNHSTLDLGGASISISEVAK